MSKGPRMSKSDLENYTKKYETCMNAKAQLTEQFIQDLVQRQFGIDKQDAEALARKAFQMSNNQKELDKVGFFLALRLVQTIQNGLQIDEVDIYNVNLPQKLEVRKKNKATDQSIGKSHRDLKKPIDVREPQNFEKPTQALDELASEFLQKSKLESTVTSQTTDANMNFGTSSQLLQSFDLNEKEKHNADIQAEPQPVVNQVTIEPIQPQESQQNVNIMEEGIQQSPQTVEPPRECKPDSPRLGLVNPSEQFLIDLPPTQFQQPIPPEEEKDQGLPKIQIPAQDSDGDEEFEILDFSPHGMVDYPTTNEVQDLLTDSAFRSVVVKPFQWIKEGYLYGGFYQCKIISVLNFKEEGQVTRCQTEEVDRRFSDFKMLQEYILKTYLADGLILPMLPDEDSLIGNILKSVQTPKNLEERREGLEKYLNEMIRQPQVSLNPVLFQFLTNKSKFEDVLKDLSLQQIVPDPQNFQLKNKLTGLFEREVPLFSFFSNSQDIHTKFYDQFRITQSKYSKLQEKYQELHELMKQVNKFYASNQVDSQHKSDAINQVITDEIMRQALKSFNRLERQYRRELYFRQPINKKLKEIESILKKVFYNIDNLKDQIQLWNNKRIKAQKDPNFFSKEELSKIQQGEEDFCVVIEKLNRNLDTIINAYPEYMQSCQSIFTANIIQAMFEVSR